MSLESLAGLGYGGAHLNTRLPKILAELQGYTISGPLTGAAAGTAIVVADGIDIQDTIVKAIQYTAGVPSDITSGTTIVDCRASGTLTCTGVVAGDKVSVNGKVYTAVTFTVTPTNGAVGPYNFAVGATDNATAQNLANAIMSGDSSLTTSVATNVVTVISRAEGTAGNSIALSDAQANGHIVKSGTTLANGRQGFAYGTVTLAAAAVADTVTVNGKVYTAVASGTLLANNQFVGGTVAVADLTNLGFSAAVAAAIIAVSNDAAAATILAYQINANDGPNVSATNGLPVFSIMPGDNGYPETEEEILISIAAAGAASAVVTLTADADTAAAGAITLTSSNGTRLAVSGAGTLTAGARAIKSTTNTTGNLVMLHWYKKSRVIGQF